MQATAQAIATETPKMKGAIDTERVIQELVCVESSKCSLRGALPEPDGHRARAMEQQDLLLLGLS